MKNKREAVDLALFSAIRDGTQREREWVYMEIIFKGIQILFVHINESR